MKEPESPTNAQIELRICAEPDYLSVARAVVRQTAQIFGLEEDKAESVALGVI